MQNKIITELLSMASKEKSLVLQRFFKTGKGEYGEGDVFCGITVPNIRKCVKKFCSEICFADLQYFLHSKYHEFRLFGLLVLIEKYEKEKILEDKQKIIDFLKISIPNFNKEIDKINDEDGFKYFFKDGSWANIRFSGTEPILRLFVETENQEEAKYLLDIIKKFITEI